MKKITALKKKLIIVPAGIVILLFCTVAGYQWWIRQNFSYEVYDDHVELVRYLGEQKRVIIPDTIKGKPVTVIREECFDHNKKIETVYLGRNIHEIERRAFADSSLKHVKGKAELETISVGVFSSCLDLQTVEVGSHVKRIEGAAFALCVKLESIGEQPELEYIGDDAFLGANSFSDFQIPEHTEMGGRTFWQSQWLWDQQQEFVVAGKGCLMAYHGDAKIVEVPRGVTKLDAEVFMACADAKGIEEIRLSETVEEVETWAFDGCEKVKVYMPESVTAIDARHLSDDPDTQRSWLIVNPLSVKELTIVTTSGSYTEEYAKQCGLECEIVEPWW